MLEPPACVSIEEFEARCIAWADGLGLVRAPRQRRSQTGHQTTEFMLFFYIPGLQHSPDLNTVHIKLGWESGLWRAVVFQHAVASIKDHSDWFGFETSLRKIEDLVKLVQTSVQAAESVNQVFRAEFNDRDVLGVRQIEIPLTALRLNKIVFPEDV